MKSLLKSLGIGLLGLFLIVAGPILFVETMCRGEAIEQAEPAYILDPNERRAEARTYMVYPEWHIVYAYEGYAEVLKTEPPHAFPFLTAITGFWFSLCGLTEKADELGEAGFDAKLTIYTIGVSFTLEMLAKAAYEETIGRLFTVFAAKVHMEDGDFWMGDRQDAVEADMALDYATFLQQTPWYKYDFDTWVEKLWAATPVEVRGWERRLAVGLEWKAKAAYARVIAKAAAGLGADQLEMQVAVTEIDQASLAEINGVEFLEQQGDVVLVKVPRYRIFTKIAEQIIEAGGSFVEIAGNDDILISVFSSGDYYVPAGVEIVSRTKRPGFEDDRVLVVTKVTNLKLVMEGLKIPSASLEHIYDY